MNLVRSFCLMFPIMIAFDVDRSPHASIHDLIGLGHSSVQSIENRMEQNRDRLIVY